jgi:hypothetical protein
MALLRTIKKQLDLLTRPSEEESTEAQLLVESKPPSKTIQRKEYTSEQQSFEKTFQSSYSHGLEFIYAIENVDLKSVRRISENSPSIQQSHSPKSFFYEKEELPQLELDLGDAYKTNMDSFVLEEPINVLGLSKLAEKSLFENNKNCLKDLIGTDLKEFVFFKGMGQGHIDEINLKLSKYIDGRPLKNCNFVDFGAWIRSLVSELDRKKTYVFMEHYQLADFFSLTPAESVEVRRLTLEKRSEWNESITQECRNAKKQSSVEINVRKINTIFIKPWMKQRFGLATYQEILERVEQISEVPSCVSLVSHFLSEVYFEGYFPFASDLIKVNEGIYCADQFIADTYEMIIYKAKSYFYNSDVNYRFFHFLNLLSRDFAKHWHGFPEGFVEKALRNSPTFRVRKGNDHQLFIKLS